MYNSSKGKEIFISVESLRDLKRAIHGFARLRIPHDAGLNQKYKTNGIKELEGCSILRELHVYGVVQTTFDSENKSNNQHKGLGGRLIQFCEKITIHNGLNKMAIISGVGVRNYYRKKGYRLHNSYMIKKLDTLSKELSWYIILIIFMVLLIIYYKLMHFIKIKIIEYYNIY